MKKIIKLMGKNLLMGSMFSIGIIITIIGVFAFESLTTTPGTAGNQSLGSQILSILSSGGFDRTTDSLEAIRNKIDTLPTSVPAGNNGFVGCETKIATPTYNTVTLTCSAGKSIRSHAISCSGGAGNYCGISSMTTNSLTGHGQFISPYNNTANPSYSASILCCND